MTNYKSVQKNTGLTPRTMAEAYRNAEYARAIHTLDEERDDIISFFSGLLAIGTGIAVGVGFVYGIVMLVK